MGISEKRPLGSNDKADRFESDRAPVPEAKEEEYEIINHPSHYTAGGIETIDFIRAKELNYPCGNAVKYIARAGKKPGVPYVQDLKKAVWYLNHEIEQVEKED